MLEKIDDAHRALKNECYYSALALALTFPDICCQVENGPDNHSSDRTRYINWVNKYMDSECFQFPMPGFEIQTFCGEMCYSLRCKVLHNGHTNVYNPKLNVFIDSFILTKPTEPEYFHGYRYKNTPQVDGSTKTTSYIGIDYLCECLCDAAQAFYDNWPNKADFNSHLF